MLNRIIELVGGLAGPRLYLVTFGLAFAETAVGLDIIVPGEAGMVVAGAAGHRGGSPLPLLVAAAAVGATAGDCVSYVLGRRFGMRLLERWDLTRRRVLPAAHRASDHFQRHGGRSVFAARWVGALRAVVPVVAGTARMAFPRFLVWNVAASLTWATAVVTVGYYAGPTLADAVDRVGGWVSAAVVALLVAVWVIRRRRRRAGDLRS